VLVGRNSEGNCYSCREVSRSFGNSLSQRSQKMVVVVGLNNVVVFRKLVQAQVNSFEIFTLAKRYRRMTLLWKVLVEILE
ncbi:hypothetical protein HAX54_047899, partial [Datura stramonium]|nr:hypothetical protein [Datura stramonium]